MPDSHDVISAFLDDEPFDAAELAAALADRAGRTLLIDLIALRHLAERYDLGYDVFAAVARAREGQARNLAAFLVSFGLPVLLTSKSFKPGVHYTDGSSALLVGHYVAERGVPLRFADDASPIPDEPHAVLLVHDEDASAMSFPAGSTIVARASARTGRSTSTWLRRSASRILPPASSCSGSPCRRSLRGASIPRSRWTTVRA